MSLLALSAVFAFMLVSCDKDIQPDIKNVTITKNEVTTSTVSATITGKYDFPGKLKGITVLLSEKEDMGKAREIPATIDNKEFSATIRELLGDKKYYYCYEFNNGLDKVVSEEVYSFKTKSYSDPEIHTDTVSSSTITACSAVCGGEIVDYEGLKIIKRGVCWSKHENPTINNNATEAGSGTGHFKSTISGLDADQRYYVRAYAINEKGEKFYGNQVEFKTKTGIPSMHIKSVHKEVNTAVCSYAVYSGNGLTVDKHGICWSKSNPEPKLDACDGNIYVGEGTGNSFEAEMDNLLAFQHYYVRVYAKNVNGYHYSDAMEFTTHKGKPYPSTVKLTKVTEVGATVSCYVFDDEGYVEITEKGYLCSTNSNPSLGNSTINFVGSGSGNCRLKYEDLAAETDYYVRLYVEYKVVNNPNAGEQHYYGEDVIHFKTTKVGGLTGAFTITDGNKVCFSRSNLRYKGSGRYWCFSNNQWESYAEEQGNSSENTNRDLLGWGTSGQNHGAICYQPWSTDVANSKYWAYGHADRNLYGGSNGINNADWGYNPIALGGNEENSGWRCLKKSEWQKLMDNCYYAGRLSMGRIAVNNTDVYNGLILLPDDWVKPAEMSFVPKAKDWTTNSYSSEEWEVMEAAGAVFLPASGCRVKPADGTQAIEVKKYNNQGYYWSSSLNDSQSAHVMTFYGNIEDGRPQMVTSERYVGRSVRLVKDL